MPNLAALMDDFDREHLWHPYTSALQPTKAFKVESAHDRTLVLADGTELLDGMSSWWCCVHGYNIPSITKAVQEQVNKLSHVMFAGLTHEGAIELGKKLLALTPEPLQKIFYADSGSVACEVAMKMAIQYQVAAGHKDKTCFITVRSGYHGDTWNAMSVCDPAGMHTLFGNDLPFRFFADSPRSLFPASEIVADGAAEPDYTFDPHDLDSLRTLIEEHHEKIAAFILEPIVQGAGGMYFYHPEYLNEARKLCDKYDILLILDEIATGFGRTGKLFACNYTSICPDIMLLGKGLTAGYLTLSAVLCTDKIATTISEHEPHAFMHGPTFMANPLACAAGCASLEYLQSYDYEAQAKMIESTFKQELKAVAGLACVHRVRALGGIGVIEFHNAVPVDKVQRRCLELGVWLRPMGHLLYAMPPLTSTKEEIEKISKAMVTLTQELNQE